MSKNHGFTLEKQEYINELHFTMNLYRHKKTGARLLSIPNDDENKVFGITFPTIPENSRGIAHIIEHSVLCGSEKYPVKEPFIELVKGSVNTFLNAFTSADHTSYPCASTNEQDFYNIVDVYLDAVFCPRLGEHVLSQEGWHYTIEESAADLEIKGVVFNEMKGAYASADSYVYRKIHQMLLEGTPYANDSGGDPEEIPELTYGEFSEFYKKWYHPSNAYIYFYGNDPEERRLEKAAEYLDKYGPEELQYPDLYSTDWSGRKSEDFPYPAGDDEDLYYKALGWLLPRNDNLDNAAGLALLSHILLGTPAAPLRKALIESGLGKDIIGSGISADYARLYFTAGMKGVARENLEKVEKLILDKLAEFVEKGIEKDAVTAALNSIEFRLRENNSERTPRGLIHMLHLLPFWIHNDDPFGPLRFEKTLYEIRNKERYFEELIEEYLLPQKDFISFTVSPDTGLMDDRTEKERKKLIEYKQKLDQNDIEKIIADTKELKRLQAIPDTAEDLATIPGLKPEQLDTGIRKTPAEELLVNGKPAGYTHPLTTNGIVYLDFAFDMSAVPEKLLGLVPLFSKCLLQMGTEDEDYTKIIQQIGINTGGIRIFKFISPVRGSDKTASYLMFRAKAVAGKIDSLSEILVKLFTQINWNNKNRFIQALLEEKAEYEAGIIPSGHIITLTRLRSAFSRSGWLREKFGGISYLFYLRELEKKSAENWPGVLKDLEELYRIIINSGAMILNLTADPENCVRAAGVLEGIREKIPAESFSAANWSISDTPESEALFMPMQVNYVGSGYPAGFDNSLPAGELSVIQKYLNTDFLWNNIRIRGGAYGAWSSFDNLAGDFSLVSYRDPLLVETFSAFSGIPDLLCDIKLTEKQIEKLIIGVIGDLDTPLLPDAQGFTALRRVLSGIDDEYRQQYRDQVFSTGKEDFRKTGQLLKSCSGEKRRVVLCSRQVFNKYPELGGDFSILEI